MGFGLAESTSGGMAGADIVTCYFDSGPVVEDRHVDWAAFQLGGLPAFFPSVDARASDWEALNVGEAGGFTSCFLRRLLDTGDVDDRVVQPGTNRIVFAHGGADAVSYHGST